MTRLNVYYEWVTEEIDKDGDIEDINGWDTFADALDMQKRCAPQRVDIGLSASWGNKDVGLKDREYIYLEGGKLPAEYESGHKVPKRFHAEIKAQLG